MSDDRAMHAIQACDNLVMFCEGMFLKAYYCPAGHLTIGYGHTGNDVYPGMTITRSEAVNFLMQDLVQCYDYLRDYVRVELNDHQLGALISLTFNVGIGNVRKSNMLKMLNEREFGTFDKANALSDPNLSGLTGMCHNWATFRRATVDNKPIILRGLVRRRAYELELFMTGEWSPAQDDAMPQRVVEDRPRPKMFRPGMQSDQVGQLHDALGVVGYQVPHSTSYTWATKKAVASFQRDHGLLVDGLYGPKTAAKLNEVLDRNHGSVTA